MKIVSSAVVLLVIAFLFCAGSVATAGLLARWEMDDGTGNTATNSVTSYHGTLVNMDNTAWVTDTPSGAGHAIELDGTNQYVNVPDHAAIDIGTSNFSIALWLKRNRSATGEGILDHEPSSGGQEGFQVLLSPDNTLRARLDGGSPYVLMDTTDTITNDASWHHILVSCDRSQSTGGRLYVDGALQGNIYDVSGIGNLSAVQDLWMGQLNGGKYLDGKLDDVQIYNQALPRSQALFLMNHPDAVTGCLEPTTGFWFNYDAAEPGADPANTWVTTTGNTTHPFTWTAAPTYVSDTAFAADPQQPGIAATYEFDGTEVAECGAYNTWQYESASFEVWLRPGDITGQEVVLDIGGGSGVSISLNGDDIQFLAHHASVSAILSAQDYLTDSRIEDFIQVVGVIDMAVGQTSLYVNGREMDNVSTVPSLWTGTDGSGLGGANNLIGGENGFDFTGYGDFDGEIAIYRFYRSALSAGEVARNYYAVAVPEPSSGLLILAAFATMLVYRLRSRRLPAD